MKGKKGKKGEKEEKVLLGRPGNTLKMGIVGLPNVGKSLTFNALSNLDVPSKNFAFCTKDPNLATVEIQDKRHKHLCEVYKPKKEVLATMRIFDIAGLVKGAHKGEGLGNAFLSHINAVDGIYHVVRAFEDMCVSHEEGDIDPVRDLDIIHQELALKDVEKVDKMLADLRARIERNNEKQAKLEIVIVEKVEKILKEGGWVKDSVWTYDEIFYLNKWLFLTAKPVIYLVNCGKIDYMEKHNKWLPKVMEHIEKKLGGGKVIPYSATYEYDVSKGKIVPDGKEYPKSLIHKIIKSGHKVLNLMNYFTCGPDEVRAWTVRQGVKAPEAAGVIHTDFRDGFICAEHFRYKDIKKLGNEKKVKEAGKRTTKGKEYVVQDGDIFLFKHNPPKKKKKAKK